MLAITLFAVILHLYETLKQCTFLTYGLTRKLVQLLLNIYEHDLRMLKNM